MAEMSRHYTLNIVPLSPLHIGSGRQLLRDYDYAVRNGRTWRIDEDALFDEMQGDDEAINEQLMRVPAAELLQPADYRPESRLFRYVVRGAPRSQEKGAVVAEQIKDAYDRPYLPGSSLKGAFRTALLSHALAQKSGALDLDRLNTNRKWAAQPLERALLGRDPNHDLLRALHVADSDPLDPNRVLSINNVQVLVGGKVGSPIEVEALQPDVQIRSHVKVDLSLFSSQAEPQLHLGDRRAWLEDVMAICRERAAPMLEAERRWFGAQASTRSLAGFFGELTAVVANMPENSCLLQIGWGGGWHNKTVGAALTDRQREDLIGRYRLARGRRERGDPFPKSRRVVVNAQGRPAAPLGWVLIEMKPEDNA